MPAAKNNYTEQRVGYLDGIRGLAILLVAAGHIFYSYYIFKAGWIGLNLFFILSGYLITQRLYVHLAGSTGSYFRNFYLRRLLRIFPLYYGCLVIFFILLPVLYPGYFKFYNELFHLQGWFWAYASNWMMIVNGIPDQPVFFHFWSLAVEEQFYIIWPFLFLMLVKVKSMPAIIVVLLLSSVVCRNLIHNSFDSYINTGTAAEPLLLGALITVLEKKKLLEKYYSWFIILTVLSVVGLGVIFINNPDLHITNNWLLRAGYSAIDIIWSCGLVLCIINKNASERTRRFFSTDWMKWLGKYSYGIYVFHWIVLNLFIYKIETELIQKGIDKYLVYFSVRIAGILLILGISYLSYNLYEKRFLRLKKYFI